MLMCVGGCAVLLPAGAAGQSAPSPDRRPIGPFAADVRIAMPGYPQTAAIAETVGVDGDDLPGRGLGLAVGAHVYPLRGRRVTLGLGGEWLSSRRGRAIGPAVEDGPEGPSIRTTFSSLAPHVSLNFGAGQGWSYLSGGLGFSRFRVTRDDLTAREGGAPRRRTIHYGGGARWFARDHLAFTIDFRFYSVAAQDAFGSDPALPPMRMTVLSAGLSVK